MAIVKGYCQCGCGEKTNIATYTHRSGQIKGEPVRFVRGHNGRGSGNGMYNGGQCFNKALGRWMADDGTGVFITRARLIMQEHLGRALDPDEIVHHLNGNPVDDRIENLRIVSRAGHMRIHRPCNQATRLKRTKAGISDGTI